MKPVRQRKIPGASVAGSGVDVLKHLSESLEEHCRRCRKRLKRCRKSFSEESVHQFRVETRRLLAAVELAGAFLPERKIRRVRDAIKRHLDTFDELRDTQVQVIYVQRMARAFPAARNFHAWLQKRETRFTRKTRRTVKHLKASRITCFLAVLQKEIRRVRKRTTRHQAFAAAWRAMNRAFDRVARQCRRLKAADTATIHRTRIAFKRFRYMAEAMSPLLSAVTAQHRQAMRGYQSMMGDIQDVEVLTATFEKYLRRKKIKTSAAEQLRHELVRRREWLIQVYLSAASRLRYFWPPPGFPGAKKTNPTKP